VSVRAEQADELQQLLNLKRPPVAMRFTDDANAAPAYQGRVAAGCVFWQHATGATPSYGDTFGYFSQGG